MKNGLDRKALLPDLKEPILDTIDFELKQRKRLKLKRTNPQLAEQEEQQEE